MCRKKSAVNATLPRRTTTSKSPKTLRPFQRSPVEDPSSSTNNYLTSNFSPTSSYNLSATSSNYSPRHYSLSNLKHRLIETPNIYDFSEIRSSTKNLLAKPFSSSSSSTSWHTTIRNKDALIFQRKLRRGITELPELKDRLSMLCKPHHSSVIKLLGACVSGNFVYLVYEYVNGASLADCLRNRLNPGYTVLSNWVCRMQIASDIAFGLEYVHHCVGLNLGFVHNHIKTASIVITDETLNARICHFGTAQLCGEAVEDGELGLGKPIDRSFDSIKSSDSSDSKLKRANSFSKKFEGTRGYMPPEFQISGVGTQRSDVFAFGVVILELLSGVEALRYVFNDASGEYRRESVIDKAREAVNAGNLRRWVDKRLKDSFPVDVAEKMVSLALECVDDDPMKRPDMRKATALISKLYLDSKDWAESFGFPIDFSVSMVPR